MITVFDLAAYILDKAAPMTAMKLQKLCYYSQAWGLVWDEEPLFPEVIQAWANGPVCVDLYQAHKGRYQLAKGDISGNAAALSESQRETVDAVLTHYGQLTAQQLSDLTHAETPWIKARTGLDAMERGSARITDADMAEYYAGLPL